MARGASTAGGRGWRRVLARVVVTVVGVQVLVAAGLAAWAWPWPEAGEAGGVGVRAVARRARSGPARAYEAGDGATLAYRAYPAADDDADLTVIALHGSGAESRYLAPLARHLAQTGDADVATPDLRGHGPDPSHRGDLDDPGQLERDLAALAAHLDRRWGDRPTVVVGHSSGGGLAARVAGGRFAERFDGFALLAPYLGHDAPSSRSGSGGWAHANVGRIAVIDSLSAVGLDWLDGADVLRFRMPAAQRDGYETLAYTHRMMTALEPADWQDSLTATPAPVLIMAGRQDHAMRPMAYTARIAPAVDADAELVDHVGHLDIVTDDRALDRLATFLDELDAPP